MKENIIVRKSFAFSVRIVKLQKYLTEQKKEFVISKQVYRSGTGIGANISEAQRAQSTADFASKLKIALKEANETQYWLHLLYETNYISKKRVFQYSFRFGRNSENFNGNLQKLCVKIYNL